MPLNELLPDGPTCQHGYWIGLCPACAALEDLAVAQKKIAELEALVPHPGDGSCDKCGAVPATHVPMVLCPECYGTEKRIAELERDQADWRKGVEFIAACAGDAQPHDLCAVRIGEMVLRMRAELEQRKGSA